MPRGPSASTSGITLRGTTVLLVEDQLLIAMDAEDMLISLGARVLTAPSAAEALSLLDSCEFHFAVLDVMLGRGTSLAIAEELDKRGIAYAFATGYAGTTSIPEEFRAKPIVHKPYDKRALEDALLKASAQSRPA